MPVYDYEHVGCVRPECKEPTVFEVTQPIKDEALTHYPTCNSLVRRLISRTSFTWKNGAPTPRHY